MTLATNLRWPASEVASSPSVIAIASFSATA